jgi:putative flippase GtrA
MRVLRDSPELLRLMRFVCVGGSGVLLNTLLLWVLTERAHLYYLASSVLATEAAIVSNFVLNHGWTFAAVRDSQHVLLRFLRFNAVSAGGLLLTVGLVFVLKQFAGVPYLLANLLAIVCGSVWNYVANRRWTWRVSGVPV